MKVIPFLAKDAADAVEQIRSTLGPEAVVLNVRKAPAQGWARLWQKPRLEVLAGVPDSATAAPALPPPPSHPSALPREWTAEAKSDADFRAGLSPARATAMLPSELSPALGSIPQQRANGAWRSAGLLERMGLLPLHAERVLERMQARHGERPPEALPQELALLREALLEFWRPAAALSADGPARPHVFVGPPGTGKTTALCKWLAQTVLMEGRPARVWRLDGRTANTAESLSVYGEILSVPVERRWSGSPAAAEGERWFIDFPGVDCQDGEALRELRDKLEQLPAPHVHLVLNAAYTTPLLLTQARAFAVLPLSDLIFTHLDEETNWSKLWNFAVGTIYSLRYLSAGQNIPGHFHAAAPEQILPTLFRPQ